MSWVQADGQQAGRLLGRVCEEARGPGEGGMQGKGQRPGGEAVL